MPDEADNDPTGDTRKQDLERVRTVVNALAEHFDSVQIFCTRHAAGDLEGTIRISVGAGNWYSREGQVRAWLITEEENHRIQARREDREDNGPI